MPRALDCTACGQPFIDPTDDGPALCVDCKRQTSLTAQQKAAVAKKEVEDATRKRAADTIRWICPYCNTASRTPRITIGHLFACPSCQQPSMVSDADARDRERQEKSEIVSSLSTTWAPELGVMLISCWIVLGLMELLNAVVLYGLFTSPKARAGEANGTMIVVVLCVMGGIAFVGLFLTAIFRTMNEVFRCRRMLEVLYSNSRS